MAADRISKPVQKILNGRILGKMINPVIIEARSNFTNVAEIVRGMIPVQKLLPKTTRLPRIFGQFTEMPFFNFKPIKRFGMMSAVLTRNLIEEVAQMRDVRRIYQDIIQYALETPPSATSPSLQPKYPLVRPDAVFKTAEGEKFTTTFFTRKIIGAAKANRQGYAGQGVTTTVIDTGARKSHPQLRRIKLHSIGIKKGMLGQDSNGHGSWTASAAGGILATDRRYNVTVEGMAPKARLESIQALGYIVGIGNTSGIIRAMDMSIKLGSDIVSMSLGSDEQLKDADNPMAVAIKHMKDAGIIPVIAAGNTGPGRATIASPGSVRDALTIGAYNPLTGNLADFSSRGPTADGRIKPDLIAPGVQTLSALVGLLGGMVDKQDPRYGPLSGTSMATPHISGLLACARQYYAEVQGTTLTVDMVKDAMAAHASEFGIEKDMEQGWGALTWDILMQYVGKGGKKPADACPSPVCGPACGCD